MDLKQYCLKAGLWKKFINMNIEDFDKKGILRKTQEKGSYVLFGPCGTGKTLLMNLRFKEYINQSIEQRLNLKVRMISMYDLLDMYTEDKPKFRELLKADILGVDDAADGFLLSSKSIEYTSTILNRIVRDRDKNCLITWFTTNLNKNELGKLQDRLLSICNEHFTWVEVAGEDRRAKK